MSSSTNADRHAEYSKSKLFLVSVLALATAGIGFSIRGDIGGALQSHFFDPIDKLHSAEMTASVLGIVFMGFAIAIAIGSPLLDYLGMGRLLGVSSLCFVIGNLVVIFADNLKGSLPVFWVVWTGMLIIGVAQGLVETVINPLSATLYPDDKTHKLNVLHAWWPGGIIIGGLISLGLGHLDFGWQARLAVVLLPAVSFGALLIGTKFPPTERVAAGVSATAMFKELGRPLFIIFWLSMFLTAASERFPRGGALLIGLMGTAGNLSIKFVLPWMGSIFDKTKIQAAGGKEAFKALTGEKLNEVQSLAAQTSFRVVAILPAILLVVFGAIWLYDKSRGGYRAEKIAVGSA